MGGANVPRRVFLARAAGLTLTLGASARSLRSHAVGDPYGGSFWLAGDHHIHTHFSPDGQYRIAEQVSAARRHGLSWCVITDHGGPRHDRIALEQAYPDLLAARGAHPGLVVFQGLEWNIPAAEHGSVILPVTADEAERAARFEALFDPANTSLPDTPANTEADALAGLKYLSSLKPEPLFLANHPARRGLDSPAEIRNWRDAAPGVATGFEGTPGHQAAFLAGIPRGYYGQKPTAESWPLYPPESYRTWGGYDYYVAKVGGLWDSLLGEGRPWFITANSDGHKHWADRTIVDSKTYESLGHTTPTEKRHEKTANADFHPGEYAKTWVCARRADSQSILQAMRGGRMFTVLGDLVDRLELTVRTRDRAAGMGETLFARRGEPLEILVRYREPALPNFGGRRPSVHHTDLILGEVFGEALDRSVSSHPGARVAARFESSQAAMQGHWRTYRYRMGGVRESFFARVRGTNTAVEHPAMDRLDTNAWEDLWFYSNPVFVEVVP